VIILDGFSCMDCQIKVSWYLLMDGGLTSQFIVNTNNNNHMMTTVTCNDAPNIDFTWKLCWLWQLSRAMTLRTLILREIMLAMTTVTCYDAANIDFTWHYVGYGNRHVLWRCEHWFYVKLCWLWQPSRAMTLRTLILREIMLAITIIEWLHDI
jgi:hypothetical protein